MPELLRMPEVAANTTSATVADWLVGENHPYRSDDHLASIETDKAVVDLDADSDGVLLRILAPAGTEVDVGDPIALIAKPGESTADVDAALASLLGTSPPGPATQGAVAQATARAEEAGPTGVGEAGPTGVGEAGPTGVGEAGPTGVGEAGPTGVGEAGPGRIFASPLARRLAKEAGIDQSTLTGSGPGGRIVRTDVERAIGLRDATPTPVAAVAPVAGGTTRVPHTRMRRAIASRLSESKRTVPHFYLRASVRADALLALRNELKGATGLKVSVNDLVVKAVATAHRAVPAMNVVWGEDALHSFTSVDIGLAVATDTGLLTPVLRDVDRLPLREVAAASVDVASRARSGALRQHELEGGTTTVTNLGMYGVEEFAAIINPPQSSILAVGAARPEPVVGPDGGVQVGTVLHLTLSVDHRAADGAVAASWMQVLATTLESPLRILV